MMVAYSSISHTIGANVHYEYTYSFLRKGCTICARQLGMDMDEQVYLQSVRCPQVWVGGAGIGGHHR